ncbi:MAG: di-trans,poly-cis-decaprenylcistransferase [Nanoarchaeota archaeon]|nr:di-trans,poly-cis-decaprenylcistransferase [Nanoarchaeota archaeon]
MDNEIPKHVAIIPDGNRRWAKEKGLIATVGHEKSAGYENILSLFSEAKKLNIKYLSVWGFSTENWKRSKLEVKTIFDLIFDLVKKLKKDSHSNKIRFRFIGRRDRLPRNLLEELKLLEIETKDYKEFNIQLCLDYGGKDEIIRAVNKILKDKKEIVTEKIFEKYLDTFEIPDLDLIIRTSGEKRISGFMPFQSTYSELYFAEKNFPDFKKEDLREAVNEFSKRKRRFGR